jgi:hypothetical protein
VAAAVDFGIEAGVSIVNASLDQASSLGSGEVEGRYAKLAWYYRDQTLQAVIVVGLIAAMVFFGWVLS